MKSREKLFGEAFSIKEKTLYEKQRENARKNEELRLKNPRVNEIENKLSCLGAKIATAVFSGDKVKLEQIQKDMKALNDERDGIINAEGIGGIRFDCPICGDTGYVSGKICGCVKEIVKQLRMNELIDSFPVKECRFDNFDLNYYSMDEDEGGVSSRKRMTAILKLCREYVINFSPKTSPNLLFMGSAGLGKTHLTLAMVSDLTMCGYDVIYSTASGLFGMLENEHFNLHTSDTIDAVLGCDLLVIDDLGSEFSSPYTKSALYNIVNSRLLSGRPTIINTNLTMAQIEGLYSARIASRFIGEYTAKKFSGRDIRQLKAMEKA